MIDYINLELFNQSSVRKDIDIAYDTDSHITNNDVVSGSFSINESAFSSKELKFGSLVSSKMSVKLYNTVDNIIDKELSVSITLNKDSNNPLKIGKYTVKSDKPTSDRLYKQIEAYDELYDVIHKDVSDWYESLAFPLTQKLFRDSFFNYVGLEQVNATLVNDDMVIEKTISANSLSGQQVLSALCELNGAIGRINRDGKFAYITLNPNPTKRIIIKRIKSKSGSYEDYDCKPISKVQIRQETNDIGAIAGTDGNTYIVQNNFLVYGKSSSDLSNVATNLLSVIQGITYRPFNVTSVYGNPCYEIGDALTVVTRNATFNTYLLNRTLNGIQAMSDTIKADGVEVYTENLNSTNTQFQQLKRQTNVLERTVEETVSKITSIEQVSSEAYEKAENAESTANSFESTISQQAKEIESKVSKTDYTGEEIASLINQTAENIKIIAKHISLEGTVTANGNFKILEDGSVEAKNGNFSGNFYANSLASERIDTYDELNVSKIHQTYDGDGHITAFTVSAPDAGPNGLDWRSVMRVGRLGTSAIWSTGHKIMDIQIKNRVNIMGSGFSVTGSTPYVTEMELPDVWPPGYIPTDVMEHPPFLDIWKNVINVYKYIDDSVGYSEVFTIDMLTGNVSCNNLTSTGKIKTTSGADLDTVKAKADGSLKSTHIGHATGTSSAFPSVDISSIKDGTIMRIEVGIPIDNTSTQTMAWFSTTVKKSTSTADYLYNCGGYYYSANYNASVFINVSSSRVTINNAWTKAIGGANAAAVNNLKSKATIYVYEENL